MSYLVSGNNPAAIKTAERNIFTATASQTTFTITQGYQAGDIDVYLNGVRLVDTEDYVANNGSTVVLNSGAAVGDSVVVVCFRPFQVADFYTKSEQDTRYVNAAGDTMTGVHRHNSYLSIGKGPANNDQITWNAIPDNAGNYTPQWTGNATAGGTIVGMPSGGNGGLEIRTLRFGTNAASQAQSAYPIAVSIDDAGRVNVPNQPAFHVRGGPTQAGAQVVQYTTVQSNIGGHYNSTSHRFTAPITGRYYFIANALKDSNHADVTLYIRKNGGTSMSDPSDNTGTGTYISLTTFAVLELVANDYIDVYIGNGNIYSGYRNFCGYLIG